MLGLPLTVAALPSSTVEATLAAASRGTTFGTRGAMFGLPLTFAALLSSSVEAPLPAASRGTTFGTR